MRFMFDAVIHFIAIFSESWMIQDLLPVTLCFWRIFFKNVIKISNNDIQNIKRFGHIVQRRAKISHLTFTQWDLNEDVNILKKI